MDFCLRLGYSREGAPLTWREASNTHISISGQSGRGKSFFLKKLIQQLPEQGVRCIVFDCSGDFRGEAPWEEDAVHIQEIDVHSVREAARIDPFRRLRLSEHYVEEYEDVAARLTGTIMDAYRFKGSAQPVYLRGAMAEFLRTRTSGAGFGALADWICRDEKRAAKMANTVIRLNDLSRMFPGGRESMEWRLREPGVTVLQFDTVPDRAVQTIVTELLLADLWAEKLQAHTPTCPVVVVLDECQRFRFREESMLMRILREGRKYHISGWFASQWIDDKTAVRALDQAALRAYFYPGDQNVHALARLLSPEPAQRERYVRLVQDLSVGRFLYRDVGGTVLMDCVDTLAQ